MTAIGYVTKNDSAGYKGHLKTVSIWVTSIQNEDKSAEIDPDFGPRPKGVEIGTGWIRRGENSGKDYVSLSFAAFEFSLRYGLRQSRPRRRPGRRQRDLESG